MKNDQIIKWIEVEANDKKYILMSTNSGICWMGTSLEAGKKWCMKHIPSNSFVSEKNDVLLQSASKLLKAYLEGKKTDFGQLLYDLKGTDFQKKVWHEMLKIPYGKTISYQTIANAVGSPKATRAVGAACGANPVMILVPCHRVVGSNGKLTGYAGGLPTKEWLLALEQH